MEILHISGVHMQIDDDLRRYVNKKIGRLLRRLRHITDVVVAFEETRRDGQLVYSCHLQVSLPHEQIVCEEATVNPFAAVDIVEVAFKQALKHRRKATR